MSKRRALFFGSLARLTGAGISVVESGEILKRYARDGTSSEAMRALGRGLERGESIAGALRPSLTDLEYRMVGAAESGGRLSAGFEHLKDYYALLAGAKSKMRQAAIYPLMILHVAAAATGVVAFIGGRPPLPSIGMSVGVLWLSLLLLWLAARGVISLARKSAPVDAFVRALPMAGAVWKNLALTRWSAVMHFHIISGQRFTTALDAAADACGSAGLGAATRRLAGAATNGQSVADAMQRERVFPEYFSLGFATAEASGTLDSETALQMKSCMEAATTSMEVLAEWLPRLLYIAALAYGAWMVFQLATSIGGQYQRALNGDF
jgi:type IV pilus assembly protein PilC